MKTNWETIQKLFSSKKDRIETRVFDRYVQLAGLVRNGVMVNKDKESRARQWVAEQEKIKFENKKNQKWWEQTLIQIIMVLGAVAGIVGLIVLFL